MAIEPHGRRQLPHWLAKETAGVGCRSSDSINLADRHTTADLKLAECRVWHQKCWDQNSVKIKIVRSSICLS